MTAPAWTATPPTEPGWYWWTPDMDYGDIEPRITKLSHNMEIYFFVFINVNDLPFNTLWCGPISPPELPENEDVR